MLQFAHDALRSRAGWLFACLHAAWFLLAIGNKPPDPAFAGLFESVAGSSATLLAGRPFHFAYEPLPLKLLILADAPAGIAMIPATLPFGLAARALGMSLVTASYAGAALVFAGATLQWLLIGHLVALRWPSSGLA